MMRQISATIRYLCFGVLFGALFPIGATCLDIGLRGGPWSLATVGLVQAAQPLHWLIDTAPVFLGLFAAIAGWQQEKLERINAVLVTQRNAQHDAEVQFQTVVSNIPGGVYRSSTSDGWPMIFVSPVIETITGYPSNDFLQNGVRTFASIIHPDDLAMTEAVSLEALRLRQSFAIEYRIIRADGQIAWIFEKGQGVYDDTGTARWIDGVIFDDTERRQSAELLQQANQQRVAAQAAIIAELSTPLIPISDRVLVMPLIGTVDSNRAQQLLSTLLEGITRAAAHTVIVDLTGIRLIDATGAELLFNAAYNARLLGAKIILTGIRPEVAQTLISLGSNFEGIVTLSTLQSGIAYALLETTGSNRSIG